jgi:hypothetical protein
VPRSVFLGRVVADGEPLWLPEDRDWALALAQVEADSCPDCGQPWSEASSRDSEDAYTAELLLCHACVASGRALRAHQGKNPNKPTDGLHVRVERRR